MRNLHQIVIPLDGRILVFGLKEADLLAGFDDSALSVDDAIESIRHEREQEAQEDTPHVK